MASCLYPGSFDPITNGHLNIIERLSKMYDEVVVCVIGNSAKQSLLTADERVDLIKYACKGMKNVRSIKGEGFTVDIARKYGCQVLGRGVRSAMDYEYESQLAFTNRYLAPEIETVFLLSDPAYGQVSSTFVREIHSLGGDISGLVPENVKLALDAMKNA